MLTALLTSSVFLLTLLSAWLYVRRLTAIDNACAEWRIAMDYIADEQCDMPHEFAACFIAGNVGAIARKFPTFQSFAKRRLEELETGFE
jgi:hypothetical protein